MPGGLVNKVASTGNSARVKAEHPSYGQKTVANVVDKSDTAITAAFHQRVSKGWQSLGFFSKTRSPVYRRYSAYDRELISAYVIIKYFRHTCMMERLNFPLFTDHKSLV
ncbi:retrovirus-related Pol polyprotein from transposon 17.6 [Nephila pilipes]|uniref:Retrovirus-related Pol polyprotein from transposon 17.6 n=1 Tax=Nephila pilipes TaxID=299642 RepID=A0A8X6NUQ1_NEPPI|nr:retrovirus-related Pol polyprotein from transposon 17.6 [Nephila pilipes]